MSANEETELAKRNADLDTCIWGRPSSSDLVPVLDPHNSRLNAGTFDDLLCVVALFVVAVHQTIES